MAWRPTATIAALKQRAKIITAIRQFFLSRGVLEVETPLLSRATVTDPHIQSIPAAFTANGDTTSKMFFLQTSPEYAMKRLLAAGSGPIYQMSKVFRQGDLGRLHNPEFTMLEWYRPGFDHHALMDEMDELLQAIFKTEPAERITYAALFDKQLGIDAHQADEAVLIACAAKHHIVIHNTSLQRNDWLDILMSHVIEPNMDHARPLFIYDFPATHAALAKIRYDNYPPVASRFEVYFKGIELANGFHELQQADEQRKRFENDLAYRQANQIVEVPMDELFLAGLKAGLPDCAGVALGIDRMMMLALQTESIKDVISFSFENA